MSIRRFTALDLDTVSRSRMICDTHVHRMSLKRVPALHLDTVSRFRMICENYVDTISTSSNIMFVACKFNSQIRTKHCFEIEIWLNIHTPNEKCRPRH
jgi:hypothetical protein